MHEPQTLTFGTAGNTLRMEIAREDNRNSPGYADARLMLEVESAGFAGQSTCWIERHVLHGFARGLQVIDQTLKGEAKLESMSPDELLLTVKALSARGQFGIEGQLGKSVHAAGHRFWHAVTFGFEIELAQLSRAAKRLAILTAEPG